MGYTDQHGFSLLEVLGALALMAIIAAIAFPGWSKLLPSVHLDSAARQVQSELHNIKMRAAAEKVGFQLAYTAGANSYTIQRDSQTLITKPLSGKTIITKEGTILLSPRGTASGNRVRLRSEIGACKQVVVSSTGRIRICTPTSCAEDC
jgi:prepilin-type N-terminal cleavage/methylation domain-containing protein